jgi:diguanylate cyclase (GGDEF)-like protein
MLANDLYHAFLRVGEKHHPAGRFVVHHGKLQHLEDYHGVLENTIPSGAVDDVTLAKIAHPGGNLRIVSDADWRSGRHLDLVPQAKLTQTLPPAPPPTSALMQNPPRPPSIWHYQRTGHDTSHTLEHHGGGKYSLDGNPLKDDELHVMLGNLQNKAATLRYKHSGVVDAVTKMEKAFTNLRKQDDEMDPDAALAHLDKTHGGDPETAKAIASLRRRVFEDPMNPGLGNKFAYEQFRKKNAPGVWASLDLNDFKHANDTFGHDAGDDLIRASGRAVRESVDPKTSKVFRSGGDEYVMHFPTYEHAAQAMRSLREKMDQITPVQGTYKPSFSAGLGPSFEHADTALRSAKQQKFKLDPVTGATTRAFAPGAVPHLVHSLVPGFEGQVPLQAEQLPKLALPEDAKPKSAPSPQFPDTSPGSASKPA